MERDDRTSRYSRREVIQLLGGAVGLGAVAACGGADPPPAPLATCILAWSKKRMRFLCRHLALITKTKGSGAPLPH